MSCSARIVRRIVLAATALAPALAAACPPAASALAPPAGAAVRLATVRSPAAGPWSKAGPGWAVIEYSASTAPAVTPAVKGATILYLASPPPQTVLYQLYYWPASYHGPAWSLADWSGDRQRVLLRGPSSPGHPTRFEQISLVTRKVVSSFALPPTVSVLGYTRPDGLNLLAIRSHGADVQVVRYDLTGKPQVVLATIKGVTSAIDSPDGAAVVIGTGTGLAEVSNTGGSVKRLTPPAAVLGCSPVRWWRTGTVLASCAARTQSLPRLWLFPAGGGKVTALTPQREGHGPDFGDVAAWRLPTGRLYLQAIRSDCSEFIGWQWRNGTLHPVTVPGTAGSNRIVTAFGPRLLVWTNRGCPAGPPSLLWFNPSTNGEVHILRTPATITGVEAVVPFGRPSTS